MMTFLSESVDWHLMEECPQILRDQFARLIGKDVGLFRPLPFAEYSCLTQFVFEEIDLVVSHQARSAAGRMQMDEFVQFWGWKGKLDSKVYELSGGWRKLLLIGLFLNQLQDSVLFIDFCSHLSDSSMKFVIDKMGQLGVINSGFIEYDPDLLTSQLSNPTMLKHASNRFVVA